MMVVAAGQDAFIMPMFVAACTWVSSSPLTARMGQCIRFRYLSGLRVRKVSNHGVRIFCVDFSDRTTGPGTVSPLLLTRLSMSMGLDVPVSLWRAISSKRAEMSAMLFSLSLLESANLLSWCSF